MRREWIGDAWFCVDLDIGLGLLSIESIFFNPIIRNLQLGSLRDGHFNEVLL